MTPQESPSFADDIANELAGELHHRRFRPGFERRLAARLAERLTSMPARLDGDLRVALAVEAELAGDATCAEAHRQWSRFIELLTAKWGRARVRAARTASAHQERARGVVDSGLRAEPVRPKSTDVPAGPFARFVLRARAADDVGGAR